MINWGFAFCYSCFTNSYDIKIEIRGIKKVFKVLEKFFKKNMYLNGKVIKRISYLICSKVLSHLSHSTCRFLRHFLGFSEKSLNFVEDIT